MIITTTIILNNSVSQNYYYHHRSFCYWQKSISAATHIPVNIKEEDDVFIMAMLIALLEKRIHGKGKKEI